MKIITLDEITFDKFANNHKYRNYYQTSAYGRTIRNHGYDIHYIGIVDDLGNLLGASLLLYKEVLMNYKIAYAPRGFLFDYTNINNLKEFTTRLKKLLSKQGFISITIDPYLPVNIRNKDGKIININNEANIALENLKASGFNYLGPNLFFESKKPRFEAIITLDKDIKEIYQSFEKRVRHKIKKAIRSGIEIYKGSKEELEIFYNLIKKKYNKPLNYYIDFYNNFEVRLKQPCNDNLRRLNAFVEEAFPNLSLQFIPVADKVKSLYTDVSRFRNAVWFTTASILLIVLIGLIGYVNDETQRRSKEIAIRKVNGAEVRDILILLSRGILNVAVPTVLLGMAVSWWVGTVWLGQFVEQITVNPLLFVGIILLILVFIVGTVVCKAWHIANENPVLSIKSE